jgi:hypothetical protein
LAQDIQPFARLIAEGVQGGPPSNA